MFQKGTGNWLKALTIGIVGCGSCLVFGAPKGDFDSDALLAEVEIDDLLISNKDEAVSSVDEGEQSDAANHPESTARQSKSKPRVEFKLDEQTVLAEIKHQIASHFEIADEFRLFFDKAWSDVTLDSPAWELIVTSFPAQGLRSRFFVNFELWCDGRRYTNYQEGMRCELWADAYVAQRQIDRGMVLNASLVAVQPVDLLSLYQSPIEIGTKLNDFVVSNTIKQGQPICNRDLKERPLIEKNNIIEVFAQEGYMRVMLKGKALEDGIKGQFIRVRNLQSHSDIQAEVVGVNQARVYF